MTTRAVFFNSPLPYAEVSALMDRLSAARAGDEIPDTVLFLEHEPVVTAGISTKAANILLSSEELAKRGIAFCRSSRGGDATCHAPGQLVMYPVLKLSGREADARRYVSGLEEIAIRSAADFGVAAFRRKGLRGAWTSAGKLAAVGVRIRKWVASHGMSLNVNMDMGIFDAIVPCGLARERVTSLEKILRGACPSLDQVRDRMLRHFETVFGRAATMGSLPGKEILPDHRTVPRVSPASPAVVA